MSRLLLMQALMLGALAGPPMAEEGHREARLPPRRRPALPDLDPEELEPRRHQHTARTRRSPFASGVVEVDHPDWRFPRGQRWGRACPACKREVAQTVKVCDRDHKPTKTRRVLLPG